MSWYEDPQLFMCNAYDRASDGFNVYRCTKDFNDPILVSDLQRVGSKVKKESSFDDLLAYLINSFLGSGSNIWRIVNCQGLAILWDQSTCGQIICSWVREPLYSPYYNLPGITPPVDAEKEDLKKRVSTLVANVQREKDEKKDLERQVSELTLKLKECCGSADEETWKRDNGTVPNDWLPLEDLDVLDIPRNTSLKIIKAPGALKFIEDNTTNVQASRFSGGIYLAAVNVEELFPDKDDSRFDPKIWGSFNDAGTFYAARKIPKTKM